MQEADSLISVTIPFYNCKSFLRETIESVLAQSYTNWELFLVDDASTDGSAAIAREYTDRLPQKIHLLEHPDHRNCGVTRSRNVGAANSRGEYLAFLDSDDTWLPDKLQLQVALLKANPEAGIVYGPSEYWYDWNANAETHETNHVQPVAPGGRMYTPPSLLVSSYPFGGFGAPGPSSFLLRRSAFDRIGGFVESFNPTTYQLYEDTAFLAKIYLNVPVFVSETCTDRYRCHPASISSRVTGTIREESERKFYCQWLRCYLLDQKIEDPGIWKIVRRKSWPYWLPLPRFATRLLRRIDNRISKRSGTNA
jgi:glycosyltransferase involved in cell wall biosynthesis